MGGGGEKQCKGKVSQKGGENGECSCGPLGPKTPAERMIKMEKRKETDRLIVLRGMINHNLQLSIESGNKVNEKYVLSHRKKKKKALI